MNYSKLGEAGIVDFEQRHAEALCTSSADANSVLDLVCWGVIPGVVLWRQGLPEALQSPQQSLGIGWSKWTRQELCSNFSESPDGHWKAVMPRSPILVWENRSEH